ncbi:MAG: hypothetical protein HC881_15950 [Leptolyngbyaceae cyanobacterium SL_7_1]|nr:hypothetical protein [Leptolyngbyaceae cyanobacterium SL_7_1]
MKNWTSIPITVLGRGSFLLGVVTIALIGVGCNLSAPRSTPSLPSESLQTAPNPAVDATPATGAERVYLADNRVSFLPPTGFTPLTPEEIELKFPNANRPQQVYANDRGTVAVAITLSEVSLTPEQLPELQQVMESSLEQAQPELQWIERGLVEINGTRWLKLESITPALDTDIRNDMYFTSLAGQMIGFNFNATVDADEAVQAELLQSRDSIQLQP